MKLFNLHYLVRKSRHYFSLAVRESRGVVANILRFLLRSKCVSDNYLIPLGFYETSYQWVKDKGLDFVGCNYSTIYPANQIERRIPKSIYQTVHSNFLRNNKDIFNEAYVATIPNGRIYGSNAAIITPDGFLLGDVSKEFAIPSNKHSIFYDWKLPKITSVNASVALLATRGGTSFMHWVLDVVPKVHLLESGGFAIGEFNHFVVNGPLKKFQLETLELLNIQQEKVINTSPSFHIRASHLVVPSRVPSMLSGYSPKWVIPYLRELFLIENNQPTERKRIYISREKATHRRVVNEKQVIRLLINKYDFEVVFPENLSVIDQARIFHSAEIVVAPHGAGLTNLVFCQPLTKVLEIFPPEYVNVCYWALSDLCNLDYYYLLGDGVILDYDPYLYHYESNYWDLEVSVLQLDETLKLMLS